MRSIEFQDPSEDQGSQRKFLRSAVDRPSPPPDQGEHQSSREFERRHRFLIDSLYRIGSHMAFDDTLDETLSSALSILSTLVNCESSCTYVLHDRKFEPWIWKRPSSEEEGRLALSQAVKKFLNEHRAPIAVSPNARGSQGFRAFDKWSQSPGETFISLPLLSRAKLVGAINFQHAPRVYSEPEFKLLATIGFVVGAEIGISLAQAENSALYEQLETRKLVERGKGILQRELGLTEEQAYLILQRRSRQNRKSMKEIAQAIIMCDDVRRSSAAN
ncbi:MAG: GAF and ANTAR domain-containing protein [Acidobacteria bacterium]|nr:GAF and ANTAR domain-containing protein [Acidobacteriota bacterium]